MAYKILYVEDQNPDSKRSDLEEVGFEVITHDPSELKIVLDEIRSDINALVLDYRLTEGIGNAYFDAPTIAQTVRLKHSKAYPKIPVVLLSNENIITDYYKDATSHDLFDFAISKKDFASDTKKFARKLISFIESYNSINSLQFNFPKILGLDPVYEGLVDSRILAKIQIDTIKDDVFAHSNFIYNNIIRSIGILIGEDVLSARLGVSKKSEDWSLLLKKMQSCEYTGVFSDIYPRWWMSKINDWWKGIVKCEIPLRRLNAAQRVEIIKSTLSLEKLDVLNKTTQSQSNNFWTICKYSHAPIDPFDGIELNEKNYLPWQEKEYISIDSALIHMDKYSNYISGIDKKEIRELAQKLNENE